MLREKCGAVLSLFVLIPFALTQTCTETETHIWNIVSRLNVCFTTYLHRIDDKSSDEIRNACKRADCGLRCFENAFSECPQTAFGISYHRSTKMAYYRAICDHPEEYADSVKHCDRLVRSGTCYLAQTSGNYSTRPTNLDGIVQFKEEYCKMANTFVTCLEKNPILPSGNCTPALANFANAIQIVDFSLSDCGNPQTHPYFTKYGGAINCATDSTTPATGAALSAKVGRCGSLSWFIIQVLSCLTVTCVMLA